MLQIVGAVALVGLGVAIGVSLPSADEEAESVAPAPSDDAPSSDPAVPPPSSTPAEPGGAMLGPEATHHERIVTAAEFGAEWPLAVDGGTVVCESPPSALGTSYVLFVDAAGTVYALNGIAEGVMDDHGWSDVEAIWQQDPTIPTANLSLRPLLDAGLELCEPVPLPEPGASQPTPAPDATVLAGVQVIVDQFWSELPPADQAAVCGLWQYAPDVARDLFVEGAEGATEALPYMEAVLDREC